MHLTGKSLPWLNEKNYFYSQKRETIKYTLKTAHFVQVCNKN